MKRIVKYCTCGEKYSSVKAETDENSIVLSSDKNLYSVLDMEKSKIYTIQGFCEYLIRKSPQVNICKTLNDFSAIYILSLIIKNMFSKNEALFNLTKSDLFAQELYLIFGELLTSNITPEILTNTLNSIDIAKSDRERLEIITDSFSSYLEILKGLNFVDKRNLSQYTADLLKKYPDYLKDVRKQFGNIIITESETLQENDNSLLEVISDNQSRFIHYFDTDDEIPVEISKSDIGKRALSIFEKFARNINSENLTESKQIEYLKFTDIKEEAEYIADDILLKISTENINYSDIALIFSEKTSEKMFKDIFYSKNIPINSGYVDIEFQNFTIKLVQYITLCENFIKLGCENIFENNITNYRIQSKSKLESVFSEINLVFENIISQTFENPFLKDKFIEIQENSGDISLLHTTKTHMNILNEADMQKLHSELKNIEQIYELYKNGKIIDIITYSASRVKEKSENFNSLLAKLFSRINPLINLSYSLTKKTPSIQTIIEILNKNQETENNDKNCVKFLNIKNEFKPEQKFVYMPSLTENADVSKSSRTQFISFDANAKISEKLHSFSTSFEQIIPYDKNILKKSAILFAKSMLFSKEKIILSTHIYEEKKQVQPSIFYQLLTQIDYENTTKATLPEIKADELSIGIQGKNGKENTRIIDENEIISMSKSSVKSYQDCPIKFYYKHLLKLKEKSTFEASYGNVVHSVMEVFNTHYLNEYSAKTLKNLAEIFFSSAENTQNAILAGFKEKHTELIKATDPLAIEDMKAQFLSAVEEIDKTDFFSKIPDEVTCEKSFEFKTDDIPNITFDGRIDAIYRFGDEYIIVDFKTGKRKKALEDYISAKGVDFRTKDGNISKSQEAEYDYQMPIYYMASQNSDELTQIKEKIQRLGMIYIKPKNQGSFVEEYVSKESFEDVLGEITANLKTSVLEKIRNEKNFAPKINYRSCANCSFKILCDKQNVEDGESND